MCPYPCATKVRASGGIGAFDDGSCARPTDVAAMTNPAKPIINRVMMLPSFPFGDQTDFLVARLFELFCCGDLECLNRGVVEDKSQPHRAALEFPDRSTSPPYQVGQLVALDDIAISAAESVVTALTGSDVVRDVTFIAAIGQLGNRIDDLYTQLSLNVGVDRKLVALDNEGACQERPASSQLFPCLQADQPVAGHPPHPDSDLPQLRW